MPAHRFSGEHVIGLKLANGYNIGVSCEGAELELLERAAPPPEATATAASPSGDLPPLTVLGTGGTIASYVDYQTGAVHPAKSAEELVAAVKDLANIANIRAEALLSLASEDMQPNDWERIAMRVNELHAEDGAGVGIGPGTICTPRMVAGVGLPQFSAIVEPALVKVSVYRVSPSRHIRPSSNT